jgi:hypothetical protein
MKEFFDHLDRVSAALGDPEYLFLVLEPLQVWGVAFGLVGLAITWFLKNEKLQIAALAVLVVSALSVLPYLQARKTAQIRIEKVFSIDYTSRAKGFSGNTADRIEHRWIFLALAGVATGAILVGPRRNRLGTGLTIACAVFSIQAINYGMWAHYQDCLAYHPNLKQNDAPVKNKIRAEPAATRTAAAETPKTKSKSAATSAKSEAPTAVIREVRPLGGATP